MRSARSRNLLRALAAVGGFLALAIGVIGFAHTKHGRPLLAFLPGMGRCPVGMDVAWTPQQRDQARAHALASVAGEALATQRPALGFALGTTSRAEVEAWASQHGVRCETKRATRFACSAVPSAATTAGLQLAEVLFLFDAGDRLMAIDASTEALSAAEAVAATTRAADAVAAATGGAPRAQGEATADYLQGGTLRQLKRELRFANYRAVISATNLGPRGIRVRGHYTAIGVGDSPPSG